MTLDVIILSNAKSDYHKMLTSNTINGAYDEGVDVTVYVHEQTEQIHHYAFHYKLDEPFNYNRFMNEGAKIGTSEYIAFCNNDLNFEKGWAEKIISSMIANNLDSASPFCRDTHGVRFKMSPTGVVRLGWNIRLEFAGWCFVMKRSSWEKIGGLDEDFSFWCADNATVEQLKAANMIHGLVTNSIVNHVAGGENTLGTVTPEEKEQLTFTQIKKFNKKYNQNLWNMGQ